MPNTSYRIYMNMEPSLRQCHYSNQYARHPYEQLVIQTFHHNGNIVPEQSQGEHNPLFQLATNTALTS